MCRAKAIAELQKTRPHNDEAFACLATGFACGNEGRDHVAEDEAKLRHKEHIERALRI